MSHKTYPQFFYQVLIYNQCNKSLRCSWIIAYHIQRVAILRDQCSQHGRRLALHCPSRWNIKCRRTSCVNNRLCKWIRDNHGGLFIRRLWTKCNSNPKLAARNIRIFARKGRGDYLELIIYPRERCFDGNIERVGLLFHDFLFFPLSFVILHRLGIFNINFKILQDPYRSFFFLQT